MSIELEDKVSSLEAELAEVRARESSLIKTAQIRQVLTDKGMSADNVNASLPLIESQISRTAEGGLAGVDGALSYLAKVRPELLKTKVASSTAAVQSTPSKGYTPPSESDERMARKVFGPTSDARLSNSLAQSNLKEYHRLKGVARALQLVA